MNEERIYSPPEKLSELTPELVRYFDGGNLAEHVGEAIQLMTADEDGWPRAAMLSVGEILAVDRSHVRLLISAHSTTTRNIERSGRVTLTLAQAGALWEIRLSAKRAGTADIDSHNTAIFATTVLSAQVHSVPYADVVSGVTYTLKDPGAVLTRWGHQIRALRPTV